MISGTASSASSPSSGPKPNTASKSSPSSRARCSTATPAQARPSNTRRQALRTSLRARPGFSACRAATSSADTIACTCSFSASRPKAASVPSRRHAPLPARSTLSSRDMAHPSFPRGPSQPGSRSTSTCSKLVHRSFFAAMRSSGCPAPRSSSTSPPPSRSSTAGAPRRAHDTSMDVSGAPFAQRFAANRNGPVAMPQREHSSSACRQARSDEGRWSTRNSAFEQRSSSSACSSAHDAPVFATTTSKRPRRSSSNRGASRTTASASSNRFGAASTAGTSPSGASPSSRAGDASASSTASAPGTPTSSCASPKRRSKSSSSVRYPKPWENSADSTATVLLPAPPEPLTTGSTKAGCPETGGREVSAGAGANRTAERGAPAPVPGPVPAVSPVGTCRRFAAA